MCFGHLTDLIQDQPVFEHLIEGHTVNDILLLVLQIWNQLLDSIDLPPLTHEWEIIAQVVEIIGVRNVNLQKVTINCFLSQLTDVALKVLWVLHPFKPASWEVLTHRPTIQVICIQVLKVTTLFPRIQPVTHLFVVQL